MPRPHTNPSARVAVNQLAMCPDLPESAPVQKMPPPPRSQSCAALAHLPSPDIRSSWRVLRHCPNDVLEAGNMQTDRRLDCSRTIRQPHDGVRVAVKRVADCMRLVA